MKNKFNKDAFVRRVLWNDYLSKNCDYRIITNGDRKGEVINETTLKIMSFHPLFLRRLTYEEFYIWAWQPIVEEKNWQKALINSYIEHRYKDDNFDIFEYCREEVIELVKEIEKDRKNLSEKQFKEEYYWNR